MIFALCGSFLYLINIFSVFIVFITSSCSGVMHGYWCLTSLNIANMISEGVHTAHLIPQRPALHLVELSYGIVRTYAASDPSNAKRCIGTSMGTRTFENQLHHIKPMYSCPTRMTGASPTGWIIPFDDQSADDRRRLSFIQT